MGIECPKCYFDNPDDTLYCGKCATPLPSSKEIPVSHTKTLETPTEELTRGTAFASRYEIIEELGKGGVGKVCRVEDKKTNEELARQRHIDPFDFAVIHAGLGEIDKAFEWLNKGYEVRAPQMVFLKNVSEPGSFLDSLGSDQRLTELLKRMNLKQ